MILKANAKINIGLDILRRREDGYHDLETVMFPLLSFCDEVEVERRARPGVQFENRGIIVDCLDADNICLKAYRLMQQRYGVDGVWITLNKQIPYGAGLGGGSSDATAVIMALNELFRLNLSEVELIALVAELGSDTAFFIRNTPQLCAGRGEVMTPITLDLSGKILVVVKPPVEVSSRRAYCAVTPRLPAVPLAQRLAQPINQWQGSVVNAFEPSVFADIPMLCQIKEHLLACGACYASMSGSGSVIYGIFEAEQLASQPLESLHFPAGSRHFQFLL